MTRHLLQTLLLLLIIPSLKAQLNQVDSIQQLASTCFQNNDFVNAKTQFEKIIRFDSVNVDALYNLGVVNLKLNDKPIAIRYFQKAVTLRDRESAKILKETLNQKIDYSDFMHTDDVDKQPTFVYKDKEYPLMDQYGLNSKLVANISSGLKKSHLIKSSNFSGRIIVQIEIDKTGKLICTIKKGSGTDNIDLEIKQLIENSGQFHPGVYQNRNVGVWAWTMPVSI